MVPFISIINSSKNLYTLTGIPSFDLLNKIEELYQLQFPDKRPHNLSYKERIVMVFMKFKQDLPFVVLSILFKNVSPESCRLIYTTIVPSLAMILNSVIYWPSKQEILSNIPYCFEKFNNTRVIIDCTEIATQKPKCLTCRIKTYSNYKSTFTLKFLIGISPGGLITYVSKPYGGRASDKAIFKQSGLIGILERFYGIMVDKGFLIDDLCLEKQIELIRPPFLKNKTTFSKAEALLNKDIASARVHIERVNQRIKSFKIFQNKFSWSHNYLAHDIMIIICGMCNLSSPIFANDKFSV